jgi:hypothetical protein
VAWTCRTDSQLERFAKSQIEVADEFFTAKVAAIMNRSTPWILTGLTCAALALPLAAADDEAKEKDADDPFAGLDLTEYKEPKAPALDRDRGVIKLRLEDAVYIKGDHSGRWNWPSFTPDRWGAYDVEITYVSTLPKMGIQFFIGDAKAKGYLPQSGGMKQPHTAVFAKIYLPDTQTHQMGILSGEDSNGAQFKLQGIRLIPACEGEEQTQGIDGTIELAAGDATTFSKKMRYEPKKEKDCLGFWTEADDWAQWRFAVHTAGKFEMRIFQGCGGGNAGSEVGVWIDGTEHKFTVIDTGGFQSWKAVDLGTVELTKGDHLVSIKPNTKVGKAVVDIQKVEMSLVVD